MIVFIRMCRVKVTKKEEDDDDEQETRNKVKLDKRTGVSMSNNCC